MRVGLFGDRAGPISDKHRCISVGDDIDLYMAVARPKIVGGSSRRALISLSLSFETYITGRL
jgi:hypothetical protein